MATQRTRFSLACPTMGIGLPCRTCGTFATQRDAKFVELHGECTACILRATAEAQHDDLLARMADESDAEIDGGAL